MNHVTITKIAEAFEFQWNPKQIQLLIFHLIYGLLWQEIRNRYIQFMIIYDVQSLSCRVACFKVNMYYGNNMKGIIQNL